MNATTTEYRTWRGVASTYGECRGKRGSNIHSPSFTQNAWTHEGRHLPPKTGWGTSDYKRQWKKQISSLKNFQVLVGSWSQEKLHPDLTYACLPKCGVHGLIESTVTCGVKRERSQPGQILAKPWIRFVPGLAIWIRPKAFEFPLSMLSPLQPLAGVRLGCHGQQSSYRPV